MVCSNCGTDTPFPATACQACRTPLPAPSNVASDSATGSYGAGTSAGTSAGTLTSHGRAGAAATGPLMAGAPFGPRYRILRELGAGGMGVVYQAWDSELGVAVALKVIRPEINADPQTALELERRFKRELLLARQVTHKHVVRIHDLGEIDGIKYLTMPYIEGRDLAQVLRERERLPPSEALTFAKHIAAGLSAAHDAGVVHRDLKPENIMIDNDGQALIMDFGISRSVTAGGATATAAGAIMGTLEYMAPEQARGVTVDHRGDLYSFGLILNDMLVGRRRIATQNALSEMMGRMQEQPAPVRTLAPDVPEALDRIVTRCLQPLPERRYDTTAALVEELGSLDPDGRPALKPVARDKQWKAATATMLVLVVLSAGTAVWLAKRGNTPPAPAREPVSVLIANFANHANDEQFDGLLEQAMAVGIEGTSFVTAFPRRDALRVARQIAPDKPLDEELARLVSRREGIDVIVAGAISHAGGSYQLELKVLNPSEPKPMLEWQTDVASKNDVLGAVGRGAAEVRGALGDTNARGGDAETFTAGSIEAAHAYAKAQELTWAGQTEAAIAQYQEAIRLDKNFGRAYSGLAALYFNTGRRDDAVRSYQSAMSHTDRMTEREKYRTRGAYYLMVRNSAKADDELGALVAKYPADSAALANLAVNRVYDREMGKALELGRRAVAIYPKNVIRRNNVALFAMYGGQFEVAEKEATAVLQDNPAFPKAFVALALSQLAQGRPVEAEATWQKLSAVPGGKAFAVSGLADLALFRGALAQAAGILEGAATPDGAFEARRLVTLAETRWSQGSVPAATTAAAAAAAAGKGDPAVLFLAGRVLAEAHRPQAVDIAATLQREVDREPRIYGALLAGEIALQRKDVRGALDHFHQAQKLADTWFGRYGLGRANLALGKFVDAESEFDRCLTKRGEATAAFLDEIATYRLLPPVYYYLGLAKAGLNNSRGAAESFQTFLDLKAGGDEQGLVADARRRLSLR